MSRDELRAAIDRFDISVSNRRARNGLLEAVASAKQATLAEVLADRSRDRLKVICRTLGLEDVGKEKAVLVDRISGNGSSTKGASTASED